MKLSALLTPVKNFFVGLFTKSLPTLKASAGAELASIEQSIIVFVGTDVGKIAIDCVSFAAASGLTGDEARAAAKAKLIVDAKAAGHDLETIGHGIVDWMTQTAFTFVSGTFAQIAAAKVS